MVTSVCSIENRRVSVCRRAPLTISCVYSAAVRIFTYCFFVFCYFYYIFNGKQRILAEEA